MNLLWWMFAAWVVVGDFLLPAFRHTYNDVMAIPMLLFGLTALGDEKIRRYWLIASCSVVGMMVLTWQIPRSMRWYYTLPSHFLGGLALVALGLAIWTIITKKTEPA